MFTSSSTINKASSANLSTILQSHNNKFRDLWRILNIHLRYLSITFRKTERNENKGTHQFVANGAVSTPKTPPQFPPLQTYYKMATSYKPSPLSYGSPRASPFRRPESPMSPSPLRQTTPTPSPSKTVPTATTPSRLANASTPTEDTGTWTPRGLTPVMKQREPSPTRGANTGASYGDMLSTTRKTGDSNALSKLQPAQVRELREGFQILDRDSDGQVGRGDVADMLAQLGE